MFSNRLGVIVLPNIDLPPTELRSTRTLSLLPLKTPQRMHRPMYASISIDAAFVHLFPFTPSGFSICFSSCCVQHAVVKYAFETRYYVVNSLHGINCNYTLLSLNIRTVPSLKTCCRGFSPTFTRK